MATNRETSRIWGNRMKSYTSEMALEFLKMGGGNKGESFHRFDMY